MDIGKGAASDAKYLIQPKIGSPDVAGDLIDVTINNPSGARSLMMEDIEEIMGIKTQEEKDAVMRYGAEATGDMDWYNNEFHPNFMNESKPWPTNNIQMPKLTRNRNRNRKTNIYTLWNMAYRYKYSK